MLTAPARKLVTDFESALLKEAQRLAVATGTATEKQGKAFWTIKPGRS